ncbi:MAG: Ig-like domain-containing protein [Gemmatimonadaceae bacterium]
MQHVYRWIVAVAIVATAVACSDPIAGPATKSRPDLTSTSAPAPGRIIFLAPLGDGELPSGASDVSRRVTVAICALADTACTGDAIARIDTGNGSSHLRVAGGDHASRAGRGYYAATWRVPRFAGDTGTQVRIQVLVDGVERGHVDVRVRSASDRRRHDSPNGSAVVSGADLDIRFWVERPPRRFTVLVGPGVRGIPGASDSLRSYGSRVPYAFLPAPGYENVAVRVDGMPVMPIGLVVTDTEHVLTVTADRHVVLSPAALPLYGQARRVLTAADPVVAYQAYLDAADEYVESPSRIHDEAMRDLRDVEFLAFDPIRDSAALRKLDGALDGMVFGVGDSSNNAGGLGAAAKSMRRVGALDAAAVTDSTERTVFLYVNGIATPQFGPEGAAATRAELRSIVAEVPRFANARSSHVQYFYNRTYREQRPTAEQQRAHCVALFASRLAFGYAGANTFGSFLAACTGDPSYRRFSDQDLLECVRQMLAILANSDAAEADAVGLAARIQIIRSSGSHVILVPHSQGNLMANQAIHSLHSVTREFDPKRDSTCIGLVSLASPTSRRWELGEHYIAPIVVRGDLVPTFDNDWPPIDTDLSHQLLDHPAVETAFKPTGIILHAVIESYLLQPQSRAAIRTALENIYRACAVSSVRVQPTSLTLTAGGSLPLSALALNAFGDTLGGRSFGWSSTSPAVVTAASTGAATAIARGVAAGGASLVAASTIHHAEAAVLVARATPIADPFTFTYLATYTEGFFGDDQHLSGTVGRPGAVPLPAGTLRLSFSQQPGRLIAAVNATLFTVGGVGSDSVTLGGNAGSTYRLGWNADHTSLSGTLDTLIWVFHVGFVRAVLPVTFARQES